MQELDMWRREMFIATSLGQNQWYEEGYRGLVCKRQWSPQGKVDTWQSEIASCLWHQQHNHPCRGQQ